MKTVDQQKLDIIRMHINSYRGNEEIDKKTRKRTVVQVRQEIFYFARKHTKLSLEYIGEQVGGLDHSTVLYGDRIVKDKMVVYKKYRDEINDIQFGLELKYKKFTSLKEEKMKMLMNAAIKTVEKNDVISLHISRGNINIIYHIDSGYIRLNDYGHQIIEPGHCSTIY